MAAGPLSPTENRKAILRTVLRWVQHEGGLTERGKIKLDDLASSIGLSRDQLNRFLTDTGKRKELDARHAEIVQRLEPTLKSKPEMPPHVRQMIEDLYGEDFFPGQDSVIRSDRVIKHRALVPPVDKAREFIQPLEGLNIVLRVANEMVELEEETFKRGVSLSLLNVPQETVQAGDYHPLFKLLQRGVTNNSLTIEGVALGRDDRIVLQGIELGTSASFHAIITPDHDRWSQYRPDPEQLTHSPVEISGLMMGLSSTRAPFAGMFEIFAVPRSCQPGKPGSEERQHFEERYAAAKEVVGVHSHAVAIEKLASLGIQITMDQIDALSERSKKSLLFRGF